jgi:hypothetical protein
MVGACFLEEYQQAGRDFFMQQIMRDYRLRKIPSPMTDFCVKVFEKRYQVYRWSFIKSRIIIVD